MAYEGVWLMEEAWFKGSGFKGSWLYRVGVDWAGGVAYEVWLWKGRGFRGAWLSEGRGLWDDLEKGAMIGAMGGADGGGGACGGAAQFGGNV